jgi:uncharacterized membrane protein YhiD involved in acid resistance
MIHSYFTVFTWEKAIFYFGAVLFVSGCSLAVCIQPFVHLECHLVQKNITYMNPSYQPDPCENVRFPQLLFLTIEECIFSRRIIAAVLLGGIIGWERRQADRPAGIRTMALVSLGSCLFSICSAFAFLRGPMAWDASRVSAAIPSGVGFLGSALIFKQDDQGSHVVRGLTTAASLWLSSAVGIACAGGLYFPAAFSTAITLVLLRFGPRTDDTEAEEETEQIEIEDEDEVTHLLQKNYNSTSAEHSEGNDVESQRLFDALSPHSGLTASQRKAQRLFDAVSPQSGLTASQREAQRGLSVRQRPGPSIKE